MRQVWKFGWAARLATLVVVCLLAGCATEIERVKTGTVYPETVALMASMNMDRGAPILVRIYKEQSTLEVWKRDRTGRYILLKSYPHLPLLGRPGTQEGRGRPSGAGGIL